jgi:hypothetical protein
VVDVLRSPQAADADVDSLFDQERSRGMPAVCFVKDEVVFLPGVTRGVSFGELSFAVLFQDRDQFRRDGHGGGHARLCCVQFGGQGFSRWCGRLFLSSLIPHSCGWIENPATYAHPPKLSRRRAPSQPPEKVAVGFDSRLPPLASHVKLDVDGGGPASLQAVVRRVVAGDRRRAAGIAR